jgi:hypothetical protein
VPLRDTVVRDGADDYLVFPADEGTATFADLASGVANGGVSGQGVTSRASRSCQLSRRTTIRASPASAKTTGMRRAPL